PRYVILRMLASQVWVARENDPLLAMFIIPNGRGHFEAVGRVDDQRADRICPVVESNTITGIHGGVLARSSADFQRVGRGAACVEVVNLLIFARNSYLLWTFIGGDTRPSPYKSLAHPRWHRLLPL